MSHREDLFVGGRWTPAGGSDLIAVIDPSTEDCIATVREASESDVDDAVNAAIGARAELAALTPEERSGLLDRWADALERRTVELISIISGEMGMPAHLAAEYQVASAVGVLRVTAKALTQVTFEQRVAHSLVVRQPVGVVAAITPWNYPLLQTASKVGPALAAGCPIVLKPSEIAPLDAYSLAEAAEEAGLPPGALNVVVGTGAHVGEALVRHPGVDMVSLTGSTRAGQRVGQLAAGRVKRVALELGGSLRRRARRRRTGACCRPCRALGDDQQWPDLHCPQPSRGALAPPGRGGGDHRPSDVRLPGGPGSRSELRSRTARLCQSGPSGERDAGARRDRRRPADLGLRP